jgi:hypothetical protein
MGSLFMNVAFMSLVYLIYLNTMLFIAYMSENDSQKSITLRTIPRISSSLISLANSIIVIPRAKKIKPNIKYGENVQKVEITDFEENENLIGLN